MLIYYFRYYQIILNSSFYSLSSNKLIFSPYNWHYIRKKSGHATCPTRPFGNKSFGQNNGREQTCVIHPREAITRYRKPAPSWVACVSAQTPDLVRKKKHYQLYNSVR